MDTLSAIRLIRWILFKLGEKDFSLKRAQDFLKKFKEETGVKVND